VAPSSPSPPASTPTETVFPTAPRAWGTTTASTGSCEVELFGADLQVAVSLPEVRSDLEWETPVPPRVTVPVDGNWWRVEVYAVGYTMAETFVRMIGSDAYQSETPEGGEESVVTSVTVPMHYNFSALCGDAQEYGNESCNPSAGGNRWTVYAANQENTSSVSMGSYSPIDQEVVGLALGEEIVVNGCTVSGLSAGTFEVDVTVDPNAHEFSGVVGPFTATGWRE